MGLAEAVSHFIDFQASAYVLIDRVEGYAQSSSNQTDVTASIPPGASDHNTDFLPDR